MDPEQEVLELTRELRDTVSTRLSTIERRLNRVEGGSPSGYEPDDQHQDGRDRDGQRRTVARGGLELAPRDSVAAWWATHAGATRVDAEQFSIGRLIQAMWSGDRTRLTEFERQALSEGIASDGGVLVPPSFAATVIDLVRARTAVIQAGATTVPMSSDSLTYPRVLTGATPKWKKEFDPMEESALTFGSLVLNAKTLRTKVKLSEELVEDMTAEGSAAIERELIAAFALEIDRVALEGSGVDPEPRGIKNTTGVLSIAAVGTPADYDFLAQAIASVRGYNHEPNAAIISAAAQGALDQAKATDNQPLQPPRSVAELENGVLTTNLVGSDAYVGEWPQLIIGARPALGVRLKTVDAGLADDFSVEIVAWQRADVGVMDPKAFCVASGITAASTIKVSEVGADTAAREKSAAKK
jgi:HK97 family phage major capsid protein